MFGILTKSQAQIVALLSIIVLLGAIWKATSQPSLSTQKPLECRCFPGDDCWPSSEEWSRFNETVRGKLIATVPLASPCHDDFPGVSYDPDKCSDIKANWARPSLHFKTTHSPMASFFANQSCDPFTPRDAQCIVGTYISYAVNASDASDYRDTIAFAREHNVRLVIRNTGHDYMGKSTGAGALAIWTHHIKDTTILDYVSSGYTGKTMKIGAGVQAFEAQAVARANGLVVVEGDCPSVGIVGGYTQGGGTSPLGSKFGLAADQVLEWDVVTGNGELLTATPSQNSDLYWALSGGGGGTYGVVLSMTVKLHQDHPTAGATLSFTESSDKYWDIIQAFLMNLPSIIDSGASVYFQFLPGNIFSLPQSYCLGGSAHDFDHLFQPTLLTLNRSGIPYEWNSRNFPCFQDAFHTLNPEMNISDVNLGGRLIPRTLVSSDDSAASLVNAIKLILTRGGIIAANSMDFHRPPTFPNSVHPAWRETLFLAFLGTMYNQYNMTENIRDQQTITHVFDPALEAITPGGAAYLNEGDIHQPNWQDVFYGPNYPRLASIKKAFDPHGIFWGPTAVGSEGWEVSTDSRLCKTRN
ncbi:FAD binding domain protein [Hypoxylon trugodes]|uniref:FAD binding domain protein n=1 Tax=Hypoxylon trugodes TaxID=326681 RepID=UPI00218FA667|nr:FAD binding domain protein [Hypoxylon trugodes]KAI1382719.1 FAD binding domain protein [Hypoxylon trugodes]